MKDHYTATEEVTKIPFSANSHESRLTSTKSRLILNPKQRNSQSHREIPN